MLDHLFFKKVSFPLAFFLILVAFWEASSMISEDLLFILPTPSKILLGILENLDRFFFHAWTTLKEIVCGACIALSFALLAAFLMKESKIVKHTLHPLFILSQSIPIFILAPIMIIWFGWSIFAIILPTALMIFFPLTLTLYQGLNAVPSEWIEFFSLHKATRWQIFTKLSLPYALPYFFSGLKISAAIAAIGAVSSEWAGAQGGLGVLIQESRRNADLTTAFGAIFFVIFLSFSLYLCVMILEKVICNKKRKPVNLIESSCESKIGDEAILNNMASSPIFDSSGFFSDQSTKQPKTQVVSKTLSLLLLICLFTACTQSNPSSIQKTTKDVRLLLDWMPNPNHVPLFVGNHQGYFEEEGILLHINKLFDPSDTIPYLTSHETDLAIYYMPQTVQAYAQGALIKVIAPLITQPLNCLLFFKDQKIHHPHDLNNKILGYPLGSLNQVYVEELCKKHQISFRKRIKLGCDLVIALSSKQVDVIEGAFWNIETEQLKALHFQPDYMPVTDLGIPHYEELIIVASDLFAKNASLTQAFRKALQKSILYCKTHPDDAFQIYLRGNPDKMARTIEWEKKAWEKTVSLFAEERYSGKECWHNFVNWMAEQNLIPPHLDITPLIEQL